MSRSKTSGSKLKPCKAGCRAFGSPVMVLHPQQYCSPRCFKNRTKATLNPVMVHCFAACTNDDGTPRMVHRDDKFCSDECLAQFHAEAGEHADLIWQELCRVRRESIDDWRDAGFRKPLMAVEDYVVPFNPHGESCLCEACNMDTATLLPGGRKAVEDEERTGTRCNWHKGKRFGGQYGITVYPSGDGMLWAESRNKTLRRRNKGTTVLEKLATLVGYNLIQDGDDGVSVEFHQCCLSEFRRYLKLGGIK